MGKGGSEARFTRGSREFGFSVRTKSLISRPDTSESRLAGFLKRLSDVRGREGRHGEDHMINQAA